MQVWFVSLFVGICEVEDGSQAARPGSLTQVATTHWVFTATKQKVRMHLSSLSAIFALNNCRDDRWESGWERFLTLGRERGP